MENVFATEHLLVRRFTEADAEALYVVLSDPEVMRYIEPPFSLEQTRAFLRDAGLCAPPLVYAVLWKGELPASVPARGVAPSLPASPLLIGHLIWHAWDENSMELGWILRRDFWGMGIARELTEALLAQTDKDVVIECCPAQAATRHLAEQFGFLLVSADEMLLQYRRTHT